MAPYRIASSLKRGCIQQGGNRLGRSGRSGLSIRVEYKREHMRVCPESLLSSSAKPPFLNKLDHLLNIGLLEQLFNIKLIFQRLHVVVDGLEDQQHM